MKLTVQLLAISVLYFLVWFPYTTVVLLQMFHNTPRLTYLMSTFIVYTPYLVVFTLPWICLLAMPEVKKKAFATTRSSMRVRYKPDKSELILALNTDQRAVRSSLLTHFL